jgi:hypothetical protein
MVLGCGQLIGLHFGLAFSARQPIRVSSLPLLIPLPLFLHCPRLSLFLCFSTAPAYPSTAPLFSWVLPLFLHDNHFSYCFEVQMPYFYIW